MWDTASIVLLATQGDLGSLRGPPRPSAMTVLQTFGTMSLLAPEQEQSLLLVTGDQLIEVVSKSTLGLEDSVKHPALASSSNLVDFVLAVCGLHLPGAPAAARTSLAVLALTLYECVAENDRRPASKGKVEMVNRLLVQKFQSAHTVTMTERVTNAELLARVMQLVPEAAAGRIGDAVSSVSPNSPNPAAIHNRKMREWRSMDLCAGVVLKMAGMHRKDREPFRLKQVLPVLPVLSS
ncbi:uncharacterized protein LOC117644553 [Thrips palmi]|uniref:Uncharacterized protein LOC117644553 n=1 Tax=Thrips palmi TaxID=161013 RepID=A0A6P8YRL6_THRPL|nr:uncharacterized protein LOC117644553 [Thrips palmi]